MYKNIVVLPSESSPKTEKEKRNIKYQGNHTQTTNGWVCSIKHAVYFHLKIIYSKF